MPSENTRRIAKNTAMLYIRMLLIMAVTLYTSRVVLNVLGVEDYGIYSVVGGGVAMYGILNSAISGATSRFLTYDLGKQDRVGLQKTFDTALTIHIGIAVLIFLLAETIGLWFVEHKLVVPDDRMFAARVVYQFSVAACMVSVTQIPYNASIIAHERMGIYAYVSIIDAVLKLLIVYLLSWIDRDKLILYSALFFVVTLIVALVYRIYCVRFFNECHYRFRYSKDRIKDMLFFSGWDLLGNMSATLRGQGINLLQNMFWGPLMNAATNIANQVLGALSMFADSFLTAVRPQIVKKYAERDYKRVQFLVNNAAKYAYLSLLFFALPLILENQLVLEVWLKNVPAHTVLFCRMNIVIAMIIVMFRPVLFAIHATGKVKYMSLLAGITYTAILPATYFYFKHGYSANTPYVLSVIAFLICSFGNMFILKKYLSAFSIKSFVWEAFGRCFVITVLSLLFPVYMHFSLSYGCGRFVMVFATSAVSIALGTFFIGMNREWRGFIVNQVRKKIRHE